MVTSCTQAEMFLWAEKERELASGMTDRELALALLDDVLGDISAAEGEFACFDHELEKYRKHSAVVREAAYRIARIREYEII